MSQVIEVFSINELSSEAKQKAIESLAQTYITLDYEWWDDIYEHAFTWLSYLGMSDVDISFDGFHHQGSGASFKAHFSSKDINEDKLKAYAPNIYKIIDTELGFFHDYVSQLPREVAVYASSEVKGHYGYSSWQFKEAYIDSEDFDSEGWQSHIDYIEYNDAEYGSEEEQQEAIMQAEGNMKIAEQVEIQVEEWLSKVHKLISGILYSSLEEEYEYLLSEEYLTEYAEMNDCYFFEDGEIEPN